MKLLVTGGAGFIGSNFVRYWQTQFPKDEITIFDKLTYAGHKENLLGLKFKFVKGDICNERAVASSMQGVDVVVHFAAESHVDRSILGPSIFVKTNILGTQVLLQKALENKVKLFHHVSTDEVFGDLPLDKPELKFTEYTRYNPRTPYSASKASSDHLVRAWHETYALPVTITNTSNNYGPYQDPEKLIPRFITNLIQNEKLPLMGKGENVRDWIHVWDHCRAIEMIIHASLKKPSLIGQTYCVGGDSERTNLQVTLAILRLLGKDRSWIQPVEHRLGHDARYAIDSSKIKKLIGWQPLHNFDDWISQTVDWYKQNPWWWKPLKNHRPIVDATAQKNLKM